MDFTVHHFIIKIHYDCFVTKALVAPFLTLPPFLCQLALPILSLSVCPLCHPPLQYTYIHNEEWAIAPLLPTHCNTCILPLCLSPHIISLSLSLFFHPLHSSSPPHLHALHLISLWLSDADICLLSLTGSRVAETVQPHLSLTNCISAMRSMYTRTNTHTHTNKHKYLVWPTIGGVGVVGGGGVERP